MENKDNRKFLSDIEFQDFKKKLEFSFYESVKLIPIFDSEKQAITETQARELLPFLFRTYMPYTANMEALSSAISDCVARNNFYLHESQLMNLDSEKDQL